MVLFPLYTINGIHEESMSLPNRKLNKMNKNYECHDQVIYIQTYRDKQLHNKVFYLINIYIHTYINPQTQSGDSAIMYSYCSTSNSQREIL